MLSSAASVGTQRTRGPQTGHTVLLPAALSRTERYWQMQYQALLVNAGVKNYFASKIIII